MLERCQESDGVKIFVGADADEAQDFPVSVIGAPYFKEGRPIGVLGVIGPQRMDYSRVVSVVDFTAKLVSDYLKLEG